MKKITILVPDDEPLEFAAGLMASVLEFHIETVPDAPGGVVGKRHRSIVHRGANGVTTRSVIMSHYTPSGMFHKGTAAKWLAEKHFSPSSASPAISGLKKDGFLKDLGGTKFEFLKPLG